jgi:hypothetical protein
MTKKPKPGKRPALQGTALKQPNVALTLARMMDAIDLNDVWVVRRASSRRGWSLRGTRPQHPLQKFVGLSAKSTEEATKIAKFVGAEYNGSSWRVSFARSKRLTGVEGFAEAFGDQVTFSVSGISSDIACVLLETLIYVEKEKRKAKRKARR